MKDPNVTKHAKKARKQLDKKAKKVTLKSLSDVLKKSSENSSSKPKYDKKIKSKHQGNFVPPPGHKFKKPSYAEIKDQKMVLVNGLKTNWNKVRTKSVDTLDRKETLVQMLNGIKGQVYQVSLRHDTSRVVQTILQFGSLEQVD